jgi:uncharacterized protein (DUF433 family)
MMELDNKWVWVSFDEITQDYNQIETQQIT